MTANSNNTIPLTSDQISTLQSFVDNKNWPAGYQYLQSIVQQQIAQGGNADNSNLQILSNWLGNAAAINADDGSWKSEFVRGETETFSLLVGKPLGDGSFQIASNGLADAVIGGIINNGEIPDASAIISQDVASAVNQLGLPPFAWAGTMFDSMPISIGGLGQDFQSITGQYLFPSSQNPGQYDAPSDPELYAQNQIANTELSLIANIVGAVRATGEVVGDALANAVVAWSNSVGAAEYANDTALLALFSDTNPAVTPMSPTDFSTLFNALSNQTLQCSQTLLDSPLTAAAGSQYEKIGELLAQAAAQGSLAPISSQLSQLINQTAINQLFGIGSMDPGLLSSIEGAYGVSLHTVSPLELDLTGNGVQTVGKSAGAYFDYSGDGLAESTGWAAPQDGLLVLPDANGQVTKGSELFGTNTVLPDGSLAPNGFAALAALDANHDGVIDANDPAFSQLRLWVGGNGQPGSGQLITLQQAGIVSLNLTYASQNLTDANGNQILMVGSYTLADGSTRAMDDVWFNVDPQKTIDVGAVAVSSSIAALPDLAGSGQLVSLHQAMALDASGALAQRVQDFVVGAATMTASDARAAAEAILLEWSGADRYTATSRGSYVNGQHVYAMEAFLGQGFVQWAGTNEGTNQPGPVAGSYVEAAYQQLLDWTESQLLLQAEPYASWLAKVSVGPGATGTQGISVDASALVAEITADYASNANLVTTELGTFAAALKGLGDKGMSVLTALRGEGSSSANGLGSLLATMGYVTVTGNAQLSQIRGVSGQDSLLLGYGNETLMAGDGNDNLVAGQGGNETMYSGSGVDTFVFNQGSGTVTLNDGFITKAAGINQDVVRLGPGITAAGTTLERSARNSDLTLAFGNGDQLIIQNFFSNGSTDPRIVFADGTTWTYAVVSQQASTLIDTTSGNNAIHGLAGVDNTMVGAAGDTIYAGNLNDTITAGAGNRLYSGAGVDTFIYQAGDGSVTLNDAYQTKTAGVDRDVMRIGAGITAAGTQVRRDTSNNLVLVFGNGDQLTVQGYFTSSSLNQTAIVFADGTRWNYAAVVGQLVLQDTGSGNTTLSGLAGVNNTIIGAAGDTIYAGNLNDTITAGKNNHLYSGAGVDTFIFNAGDGTVTLNDAYRVKTAGVDQDVMQIGAGITAAGTQVRRDASNNLVLMFGNGDQLTVQGYFTSSTLNQTAIVFADGTRWNYAAVVSQMVLQDTGAGNTTLYGLNGIDNTMIGAAGDSIFAGNLNDTITAGKNGRLYSGAGVDTFIYQAGDGSVTLNDGYQTKTAGVDRDVMQIGAGITAAGTQIKRDLSNNLVLVFGNGDQLTVQGYFTKSSLNQTAIVFADGTRWDYATVTSQLVLQDTSTGNTTLYGLNGIDNTMIGAAGDSIFAGNLNDTITAGKNNHLYSGAGVDTFIYQAGDGAVTLNDAYQTKTAGVDQDVMQIGAGITAAGTQVRRDLSNNLLLVFGNGDQLTVQGYFTKSSLNQTAIVFADGTRWNYAAIVSQMVLQDTGIGGATLSGLSGINNTMIGATGDSILAGNLNDTITAGRNNHLYSGAGVDTFIFNAGDGTVTLNDAYQTKTAGVDQDVMRIGAGITAAGTLVRRDLSNNLLLIFGNGDQLTVQGYFTKSSLNQTAIVFADGTRWNYAAVTSQMVLQDTSTGNTTLSGLAGIDNTMIGATGDSIFAGNLNDTITAGKSNHLYSGAGVDTFIFNAGDGIVTLNDAYQTKTTGINQDIMQIGAGITAAGTQVRRDTSNNLLLIFGNGDQLTVQGYFTKSSLNQTAIVFADGTRWNYAAVTSQMVLQDTSAGNNSISGLAGINNTMIGAAGDTIYAGNLNDTITAGKNNHLYSGAGVDTFIFNAGDGSVTLNDAYQIKTAGIDQDVVRVGTGITAAGAQVKRDTSGNLLLVFGNGDQLTVQGYFTSSTLNQTAIVFADGTRWNYAAVVGQLVQQDLTSGSNTLHGLAGANNTIIGASNDTIYAGDLNDTITAGKNNRLYSGAGVDTFVFNAGDGSVMLNDSYQPKTAGVNQDVLQIGAGITAAGTQVLRDAANNLVLKFGNGDQLTVLTYFGNSGQNASTITFADGTSWHYSDVANLLAPQQPPATVQTIDTSAGGKVLQGTSGVDNLITGAANDTIYAGNLNDTITAGKNNRLYSGAGVDTFVFNAGDGAVTLNDVYQIKSSGINQDVMQIGSGISAAGTLVRRDLSNNLVLIFGNGDQLSVQGYFNNSATNQTSIVFADGTSWNYATVVGQMVLQDTSAGNNSISGLAGINNTMIGATGDTIVAGNLNDTIVAGKNDRLYSGAGIDTFVFNAGDGAVTLNDVYQTKTAGIDQDVMQIGAGITAAGTLVRRDLSNNLVLIFGNGDQLSVQGYFNNSATNQTSIVFADGTSWNYATVVGQLVLQDTSAGNNSINGLAGINNTLIGAAGDTIYAGNLNDTITAGKNNRLYAGAGVDTFIFNAGDGSVTLNDAYQAKATGINQDVMQIGAGITAAGTIVRRDTSNNLVLTFGNGDQLTVQGYFNSGVTNQTAIVFADGTRWNYAAVTSQMVLQDTSAGNNSLSGLNGINNTMIGAAGDTIYAGNLNDTITAGRNGRLYSGTGIDTFIFNAGDGIVTLNDAYQTKTAGINQDVMQIGAGISAAGTLVRRDLSNNLLLIFGNGDQLTVQGYFNNSNLNQTAVVFADGTRWNYATVIGQMVLQDTSAGNNSLNGLSGINNTMIGAAGDSIYAGNLNDTITAGRNNRLYAGAGVDTFIYQAGDGAVTLNEAYQTRTAGIDQDVVQLGTGITAAGTQVRRDLSNNLVLIFGNGDQLSVQGYFTNASLNQTAIVFADGTSWNYATVIGQMVLQDTSAGNTTLNGLAGINNTMIGATGDTIYAGNLNDTITAGRNNRLYAGAGVDTFIYQAGDGAVTLNDAYQTKTAGINQDVMQIGAGITAAGTLVRRDLSNNLLLVFGNGDQLTVQGYFGNASLNQTAIVFADGTSWNYAAIVNQLVLQDTSTGNNSINGLTGINNTMIGAAGDTIYAGNLNDTITAGAGNHLYSGAGTDTFIYQAGDGVVTLNDAYQTKTAGIDQDVMRIGAGITAAGTLVRRDLSNNLLLVFGNGDQLTVQGYFNNASLNQTSIVFADGTRWNYSAVTSQLVTQDTSAGNSTIYGLTGVNNTMIGAAGDTIYAGNLNDTITAGRNDRLYSGAGIDTFVFNAGDGAVTLNDAYQTRTAGINQDVMQIGAGITAAGTQVMRDLSNNLVLVFGNGDQLTVQGYFTTSSLNQTAIAFADGTSWSFAAVTSRAVLYDTSTGGHTIYGLNGINNTMVGAAGDYMYAGNLNDTITAGRNNTLYAGAGVDLFEASFGDGAVTINETTKTSGTNQDTLLISGANPNQLWFQMSGSNLVIDLMGTTDHVTLNNWTSTANQLQTIEVDNGASGKSLLNASAVNQLVQAMASFSSSNPGFDPTSPSASTITDPNVLLAVNSGWHH